MRRDDRGPPHKARHQTTVDKQKTTPFLLRLFLAPPTLGGHLPESAYTSYTSTPSQASEVQLYVWRDQSLKDILTLFLSSRSAPPNTSRYSFRHVWFDPDLDRFVTRDLGILFARDLTKSSLLTSTEDRDESRRDKETYVRGPANKTLADLKFLVGDFIEIAFMSALSQQSSTNGQAAAGGTLLSNAIRGVNAGDRRGIVAPQSGAFSIRGAANGFQPRGGGGGGDLVNTRAPEGSWKKNADVMQDDDVQMSNGRERSIPPPRDPGPVNNDTEVGPWG